MSLAELEPTSSSPERRPWSRHNGTTSGTNITPLRRADIPELSQFLITDPATSYRFSHDVLLWKYFDGPSGPSEDSASSLIARSAGKIVGHIGMCPRQFIVSGDGATPVSTMHAIDWRASDAHPGVGALLMLQAFATSKTQYAIGGTEQAEGIFPRLGFEQKPNARHFLQTAHTIPSLAFIGSTVTPEVGRDGEGRGDRLASAHTTGAAGSRTTLGTCVHRRNWLLTYDSLHYAL